MIIFSYIPTNLFFINDQLVFWLGYLTKTLNMKSGKLTTVTHDPLSLLMSISIIISWVSGTLSVSISGFFCYITMYKCIYFLK